MTDPTQQQRTLTSTEVLEHLRQGWALVVSREFETNYDDDISCFGIEGVCLSKSGEVDIEISPVVFEEIEDQLSEPEWTALCEYTYMLESKIGE